MQCVRNEHFFCNQCITRFLRQAQRCPNCNEPLTLQTLRPSRVIRDFVQELVIKCDNFARGCGDSVKLENLEAHVARCGFSQVQCSNEGCELIVNRKDQPEHEMNDCNFRLARCQVCGENVNYSKRKLHCYVSRREMDEVKELVLNMSKEMAKLTRSVGEVKDEMKREMGEVKREMAAMKKESHRSKQEPESDARSLGASFTCFQPSINIREDIIIAGGADDLKSVEMFSWPTRQWTLLPPMTSPRCFSSSCVHEGQMFVCGGVWSDTIETLELKKERGEWKEFQVKLPQKTWGHENTIYEENLFIFGGEK